MSHRNLAYFLSILMILSLMAYAPSRVEAVDSVGKSSTTWGKIKDYGQTESRKDSNVLAAPMIAGNNRQLDLSMVKSGDILLAHASGSRRVEYGISYYTHVALVLDKYSTIEVAGFGKKVDVYPIGNWLKTFSNGYYTKVVVARVNTPDYLKKVAVDKAKGEWRKPYFLDPRAKFPYPQYHYCSSLVWHAYKWGVLIDLDSNGGIWVTPDDIALDNDIQLISVQGN